MTVATSCRTCGIELRPNARFCDACGSPLAGQRESAEYKQVTALFADVVRSMDIAAALGPERWREVMSELVDRASVVLRRYRGTVDKFAGDGIMALFGAPVAFEDHALRACLAALGIQEEAQRLAEEVQRRDGVSLRLRVGLNSGQVVAGGIGRQPLTYTAVGAHVGMAERMQSVAPPGGVMISESTARLVEHATVLCASELVDIKGGDAPVPARRLLRIAPQHGHVGYAESKLVGRRWELAALEGVLDRSIEGHGTVVGVVGPSGIGKSRLAREAASMAAGRGVDLFWAFCESHADEISFHVVTRLLRAAFGVGDLGDEAARQQVRAQVPDADEQNLVLLDDLLGIAQPDVVLPKIDPDARRRRLTALLNAASLARPRPAVYIVEDAHWIDEVSESMLADFITAVSQTPSMVLITYRPEYQGVLARVAGAQTIALAPLSDSEISALIADLIGPDPSVVELATVIVARAAGNPFFAQEIVRDLTERGVLQGDRGAYACREDIAEVSVPATLQTTIAARIDRLAPAAKRTLTAAAVVGMRFDTDLLASLGIDPVVHDLVRDEFIDRVEFTAPEEYAFRHPLIHAVAYETQLKSDRAELHRRLAAAIEGRDPQSVEANAALIAEHLEAAGDVPAAYGWHMRAAAWSTSRDIAAARLSWDRASQAADALPADTPDRTAMRIGPRTLLCGSAWRVHARVSGPLFEELRQLCALADDKASLAAGMAGLVMEHANSGRLREASQVASEYMALVDTIGNPMLTIALSFAAIQAKCETDEVNDMLRWSQKVIELCHGDPTVGNFIIGSPLAAAHAARGFARWGLGHHGWREDLDQAVAIARDTDPISHAIVVGYKYTPGIPAGVLFADDDALRDIKEALEVLEHSGDDFGLALLRFALALALVHRGEQDRERGVQVLAQVREMCLQGRYTATELPVADLYAARERARGGDFDGALPVIRDAVDDLFNAGQLGWCNPATRVLVETLLARATEADVREAEAAIERLAATAADGGVAMHEITLLRLNTLLAKAHGEETAYRDLLHSYRLLSKSRGYDGHMAMTEAMT